MPNPQSDKLLQIVDSPVLPRSYTIPSQHLVIASPEGPTPLAYVFHKGEAPTLVDDDADREMMLRMSRRVTGPVGKGLADVQLFEVATPEQRVAKLSDKDKVSALLLGLEQQGIDVAALIAGALRNNTVVPDMALPATVPVGTTVSMFGGLAGDAPVSPAAVETDDL